MQIKLAFKTNCRQYLHAKTQKFEWEMEIFANYSEHTLANLISSKRVENS